jgi:hypothetical protein
MNAMGSNDIPVENYSPRLNDDQRVDPPAVGSEVETLTSFLEFHRRTFEVKCAGLSPAELSRKAVEPSDLSLHGILRHLSGVERWWFQIQFAGHDVPMLYYSNDDPDQDFERLDGDIDAAFATWRAECRRSREIVDAAASLEVTGRRRRDGKPISLRHILVMMIAEYARHNGHADLLRERIDGATGQ